MLAVRVKAGDGGARLELEVLLGSVGGVDTGEGSVYNDDVIKRGTGRIHIRDQKRRRK